jgi:MYXO-CTERM domain-containing protein
MCTEGACVDKPKPDGGVAVPPVTGTGGGAGSSDFIGSAGSTGSATGTAGGAGGAAGSGEITASNGCRCDAGPATGGGWLALLALAGLLARRPRARR